MKDWMKNMDDDGARALCTAITLRAVEDYAPVALSRNGGRARLELERFFYSQWFELISDYDGPSLMRAIKEQMDAKSKAHKGQKKSAGSGKDWWNAGRLQNGHETARS